MRVLYSISAVGLLLFYTKSSSRAVQIRHSQMYIPLSLLLLSLIDIKFPSLVYFTFNSAVIIYILYILSNKIRYFEIRTQGNAQRFIRLSALSGLESALSGLESNNDLYRLQSY